MERPPPLVLYLEHADGQEVSMQVDPEDDFHTFLVNAKALLGYDVDINSITHNQPISLSDNIYQFLLKTLTSDPSKNEDLYILDDGTQIRASQIHFDNEDPPVDLTKENIPFVKFNDVFHEEPKEEDVEVKTYKITASPVRNPKEGCLMIPFKLVCNSSSGYEAQFTKYLEATCRNYTALSLSNRDYLYEPARSLIRENFNYENNFKARSNNDPITQFPPDEILNRFQPSFPEKRRNLCKNDPPRLMHQNRKPISYVDVDGVLIAEAESQSCFICNKFVDNNMDKLYLFDNEDQRLHRTSPQKKLSTQLKIICEQCLRMNFKPCRLKSPNQSLNPDEYLVIQNNQQYIFQKTKHFVVSENVPISNKPKKMDFLQNNERPELVNLDIGSDGKIVTQPAERDGDGNIVVKDEKKDSSSDVEIIETVGPDIDDHIIDNLDEADDEVIEFLGKTKCDGNEIKELKCRFCAILFPDIDEVIGHGEVHKHFMEGEDVYPCPICDYGYANFKWLKGHLKTAHSRTIVKTEETPINDQTKDDEKGGEKGTASPDNPDINSSPVAKRTRSSAKTSVSDQKETLPNTEGSQDITQLESKFVIKTEVKQEAMDSSSEEIWIVHTADEQADQQLKELLESANKSENDERIYKHRCTICSQLFETSERLADHKCRSRGRKRKDCLSSKREVLRRTQRLRNLDDSEEDSSELMVRKPRKKKSKEPISNPQVVTCHNCNESFTSKVRLKFHMQFHDPTDLLTPEGEYRCGECEGTRFPTETELFDHVHFQHDKQRRWQCPVLHCGKTFFLRATLTKHSRTHTDTRRYVCGTCGKRFLDKQTLNEHGVTHLRIKPFQCHICLKQLTRRSRLRMHLRGHEEELCPRLVLVCCVCERAFRHELDAQEHITRFPECVEEYASELKQEEVVTMQLSPTSGIVRHTVPVVESPKLCLPILREASGPEAALLLSRVADEARLITRVVQIEKAFRCEYCEDVFYSENGLNNHRMIHKGVENPFTCHICKVTFATYSRCTTHKTTHGFYKRSLADAKNQSDTSKDPGSSCTGILGYGDFPVVKHFLCEDCGRSYLHWTYLQVHRRMKHAAAHHTHSCGAAGCHMAFPNSWSLAYHKKKVHGNTKETENDGADKPSNRTDYRIPCRDCDEVLPNKTALYKHRKKEHSDPTLKANTKNNGVFCCGYCNRRYTSRTGLNAHALTHCRGDTKTSNSDLTCTVCKKSFADAAALAVHARLACGARAHACAVCGHVFRTLSMLTEHTRVHTGERPFPCDVCGQAFRRSTALRNHRLIHSGVRAWGCARCPQRFRIRSDLRAHLRAKHPATYIVIEVSGLNPSPEEVMERLTANNIPHDKIIEITKMSFPKGAKNIIPSCARALDMLEHVPRTQVACSRSKADRPFELYQPTRRGRGIAKNPRKQKLSQRDVDEQGNEDYCRIFRLNQPPPFPELNASTSQTSVPTSMPSLYSTQTNVPTSITNLYNSQTIVPNMYTSQTIASNLYNPQTSVPTSINNLYSSQTIAPTSITSFYTSMANVYTSIANMSAVSMARNNDCDSMHSTSAMPHISTYLTDMYNSIDNMSNNMANMPSYPPTMFATHNMPISVQNLSIPNMVVANTAPNMSVPTNISNSGANLSTSQVHTSSMVTSSMAVSNTSQQNLAASGNEQERQEVQPSGSQYPQDMAALPIAFNVSGGDLPELNLQLLLRDGMLVSGNQMMQLQVDDDDFAPRIDS